MLSFKRGVQIIFWINVLLLVTVLSASVLYAEDGTEKWFFQTGGDVCSPAIGLDGTIYVGSEDCIIYAINPDGTQKWSFQIGDIVDDSSPAIGSDGTIYVGSIDDKLYAINPDGTQKWSFQTGGDVGSSPAIGSDGTIYVGSSDYKLYAINADGTLKWSFQAQDEVWSSPAIGTDGTIYVGSRENDGHLYAVNPDGTLKWKFYAGDDVESSPAIGTDGTIYVGSDNYMIYAINPDGTLKWSFDAGDDVWSSAVIGPDGTIYMNADRDNEGQFYAINPDGTLKWCFLTGGESPASAAIGQNGTIYAVSGVGMIYALNTDGTEKWSFQAGGGVSAGPAIGPDGTIYVGSEDGKLYAINGSSGGLAESPWPMFHHDLRHTGRVLYTTVPNNPPSKPALSSPADGAINVPLTPTLQTGNFSDPDGGDVHLQTEWQVSTISDFSSTILDTTSISLLTLLTVPQFVLAEGVTCFWRARFYDNQTNVSEWSDVYSFTTLTTSNDQNGNGIPDSQENDTADLDNDGTADIEQDDIKSLNTVVGEGQMGVSRKNAPTVTAIESIESIDPETISDIARPYSMQLGLFAMRLTVANPGDTVQVTVYFSEAAPSGAKWYIYDSIDDWVDYSDHATFSADRKSVILELKDGDYGDADNVANGTIVDPGGFGLASWIEGLICDSSTNQGIARAQVTISELVLSSDLDGHYLSMILPGTYTLAVSASGYDPATYGNVVVPEGETFTQDVALSAIPGDMVTSDLWIRAVINTEEKGPIDAVWQKGGEDTTSRGDRVIWGHFYASPNDVTWGSQNNPDLFAKIWFDVSGRIDVNYFHVSVPDIEVYSDYPYDGTADEQGTTTMSRRYIRQYYENGQCYSEDNYEDGVPAAGYSPAGNPSGYSTINDLRIGSIINSVEKGPIDAIWRLGGQDTTSRGDQVVWGLYYASPTDVTWGSQDNPDLFVKIWFDVSGRVDVNFFHVSVPDIEVYSDLPSDGTYDQKGTTIMDDRYIRHEYWR